MRREAAGFDFADGRRDGLVVWVPAIVGVGLLAGLLLMILAWPPAGSTGGPSAEYTAGPATASPAGPLIPRSPAEPPSVGGRTITSRSPRDRSAPPAPARSAVSKAPRTPPPADVTGRYRVRDSYRSGFIGEVVISNGSGGPRPWTVRLAFGGNVGAMRTFWVESQPQAALRRSGPEYVFTGSVPVAARSSVVLRFQFDRWGSTSTPLICSTNGLSCAGT